MSISKLAIAELFSPAREDLASPLHGVVRRQQRTGGSQRQEPSQHARTPLN